MPLIDDYKAAQGRAQQAQVDAAAIVEQMTDVLYNRLRSLPALSWISDATLRDSCRQFAVTALDKTSAGA